MMKKIYVVEKCFGREVNSSGPHPGFPINREVGVRLLRAKELG